MSASVATPGRSPGAGRWTPFALITLMVVPAVAGTMRLIEVAGGPHLLPANARLTDWPVPVSVHIVGGVLYAVLGAFQFSAGLRRRRLGWHRRAGRVLVGLGLAVALSALAMTLFTTRQPGTGALAYASRLGAGVGMAASIVVGFASIRRGDVERHRAWMTRAFALALGAGTQVLTQPIGAAVLGPSVLGTSVLTTDLMLAAGWVINLVVAECVIRRPFAGLRARRHTARRTGRRTDATAEVVS